MNKIRVFEGKRKEILSWNLEKGVLYVNGTGEIPDTLCGRVKLSLPWQEQKDTIQRIVIGEGITSIGVKNFESYGMLETVSLPGSMKRVHHRAFYNCERLKTIETKGNVDFRHVYEPKEITENSDRKRGERKQTIVFGRKAFGCTKWALKQFGPFYIKEGVLYEGFVYEKDMVIPKGVFKINKFAFENSDIFRVKFSESVEVIDDYAFSNTRLKRVVIPKNVKKIGYGAFKNCPLEIFIVEDEEMTIDENAFKGTKVSYNPKRVLPSVYELFNQPEHSYKKFKRIVVREKKPCWLKDEQEGRYLKKAVFGSKKIDVGKSLIRKLCAKSIVIGISYEEGVIRCVKSLRSLGNGLLEEYLMYPCDAGEFSVSIWRDSFTYQEREDVLCEFPTGNMPEQLIEKGKIRMEHPGEEEEWFWSNDRYNFGGPLECELLEQWLASHKGEYRVQSWEENAEEDKYRWFVEL